MPALMHGPPTSIFLCIALLSTSASSKDRSTEPQAENQPLWEVTRAWDDRAERDFSEWVEHLGEARRTGECRRLKSCLSNPKANLLWDEGERWKRLFADCADLPYVMRAYFAWKTGRPFQFTSRIHGARYSRRNRVHSLADFTDPRFKAVPTMLRTMAAWIHSGYFRMRK